LFYSLASIALAYTGMTLRRTDRKSPDEEKQFKKENKLALQVSTLEQQFKHQCLALVAARQEAFESIKAVPQTVSLSSGNTQTKVSRNYLPWVACVLITMMGFGTILTTVAMNRELRQQDLLVKQSVDNLEQVEVQRTINSVMDAVVVVKTEEGTGSGFFIDSDGLLVTNYHVVEELNEVNVMTRSGLSLLGQVIRRDKLADLALIKVTGSKYPVAKLADASSLQLGDTVFLFGAPLGFEWSVTKGIVSGLRDVEGATVIQTDAALNFGNSGGPLLHLPTGNVIGVNTFKTSDTISDGLGFAVACQEIRESFPETKNLF
jgi:S1-C subfamily serine protease